MDKNVRDHLPSQAPQTSTTSIVVRPTSSAATATIIERAERLLAERAQSTTRLVHAKQAQLHELRSAATRPLELARSIASGSEQAASQLSSLERETTAVIEEIERTGLAWHSLERRSRSKTLWVLLSGVAGAGKSTSVSSAIGVPGVVPSGGGRPVSGATVRIVHDPTAVARRATLVLDDGSSHTAHGDEIDGWITQYDRNDQELHRYRKIRDAEIQVAFRNPLAELFTFVDAPGVIDGRMTEQHQLIEATQHACDVLLIIDRPLPSNYREVLTPANHVAYDFMTSIPSFVFINRSSVSDRNCELRHAELTACGIPADRILTADCSNTTEVNHVLVTVLESFLTSKR